MDETQDVGLEGAENTKSPVSTKQPIESAPHQSQEFLELRKQLELTRSELKGLQSRQDKETNEVQRFMGEVKKRMASGMSLEEAEKAVVADEQAAKKDDLLLKIAQKVGVLDQPSAPPAGNGNTPTIDTASVLSKYELDGSDPEVIEKVLRGKFNSPADAELAALRIAYQRAKPNQPSPSAAPSLVGSTPQQTSGEKSLLAEFEKENAKIPRGAGFIYQRSELKKKYREAARRQGFTLNI